jgi:hypothetical protein
VATVQTNISSFTTTFALRERRKSGYLKMREIHLLYWATCGSVPGRGGRSGRGHRCQTPRLGYPPHRERRGGQDMEDRDRGGPRGTEQELLGAGNGRQAPITIKVGVSGIHVRTVGAL